MTSSLGASISVFGGFDNGEGRGTRLVRSGVLAEAMAARAREVIPGAVVGRFSGADAFVKGAEEYLACGGLSQLLIRNVCHVQKSQQRAETAAKRSAK
jgi:hypothetical protein